MSPAAFPENIASITSEKKRADLDVAAVDLGSNSFHMIIARFQGEDLTILDRLREPVRLADGLDAEHRLSPEAQERAIACLSRFGQRIRGLPASCVRAVGTNTLRMATREREFRTRARQALGYPIEVISGLEEARLIYQGITHTNPGTGKRLLAVDIGGGSTEVMLGRGFDLERAHSLFMGCVSYSNDYFPNGQLRREFFREAETAAGLEFRTIAAPMRDAGCRDALGSSGTIEAVADLVRANQLSGGPITLDALKKLRKLLVQKGKTENLDLPGMKADRRPVLAGGLAILIAAFKSLDLETMTLSAGALREGVLYDLIGRIRHQDVRDRTIRSFVDRFRVDVSQAARVEKTVLAFLADVGAPEGFDDESARALLSWAAWLHEIGLVVAYAGYHRHGAYLVANSDLPGFSRDDQLLLASLVRAHRRRLRDEAFADVPAGRLDAARKLIVLLRLAVLFHRSRDARRQIRPRLEWKDHTMRLVFPPGWTEKHPLTAADLEQEREFLAQAKIGLDVSESKVDAKAAAKRK